MYVPKLVLLFASMSKKLYSHCSSRSLLTLVCDLNWGSSPPINGYLVFTVKAGTFLEFVSGHNSNVLYKTSLFLMGNRYLYGKFKGEYLIFTTGMEYTTVITRTTFVLIRNASRLYSNP